MPVYEFFCSSCSRTYEYKLTIEESKPSVCDVCGYPLRRIWQAVPVKYGDKDFTQYRGRNMAGEPIVDRKK